MSIITKSLAAVLLPGTLGLGMIGVTAVTAKQSENSPVRCEIKVKDQGGTVALEGIVRADATTQGSYHFRVIKSGGGGSANIDQRGEFKAGPDNPGQLGSVMLGSNGGTYVAKLTVTADGQTFECSEKVGGSL
jgi:hypothetical protein